MKKILTMLLSLLLLLCVVGCSSSNINTNASSVSDASSNDTPSENTSSIASLDASSNEPTVDPATCTHEYEEKVTRRPRVLDVGEKTFTCKFCNTAYTEEIAKTDTVKILAVGNSLTSNATQYLWEIITSAGVPMENVVIGRLFLPGCSIEWHWQNIVDDVADYDYSKNNAGNWVPYRDYSVQKAIDDEEWDYIIVQETIASVQNTSAYRNLGNLVDYLKIAEPEAELAWHLIWTYQAETESQWCKFRTPAETLEHYGQIVGQYLAQVKNKSQIEHLIPAGTAVQNLRSSYIGDTITTDGIHVNEKHGMYITALTWYAALAGGDLDAITWVPTKYPELANDLPVIRQSVKDAMKEPFVITQQAK